MVPRIFLEFNNEIEADKDSWFMRLKWTWLPLCLLFFNKNITVFAMTEEQIREEYYKKDLNSLFIILNDINRKPLTSATKEEKEKKEEEIKLRKKILIELISKEEIKSKIGKSKKITSNNLDKKNTIIIKNLLLEENEKKQENLLSFRKLTNSSYINLNKKFENKFQEQIKNNLDNKIHQTECNNKSEIEKKFLKLLEDNKKIFSIYKPEKIQKECLKIMKRIKNISTKNMSCSNIPPDQVGDSGAKVFILKKDNKPEYVIKSFKSRFDCTGEISKLRILNNDLDLALKYSIDNDNVSSFPQIKIPNELDFAKFLEGNTDSDPCFLVLKAASGKPLYSYAKDYIDSSNTGISQIFYRLGKVIGSLHKENTQGNRNRDILDLMTVSHGDLHIKNIFYDIIQRKFTLIDNKDFSSGQKNSADISNILTIFRQMVIDIKKGSSGPNHQKAKIDRATFLAKEFIRGYADIFSDKNEYELEPLLKKIGFVSNIK